MDDGVLNVVDLLHLLQKPHIYGLHMLLCCGVLASSISEYAYTYRADRFRAKSCLSCRQIFSL
jgi:hypothetical protein